MGFIYLLHFNQPLKHAKHYLGYSENNPEERIELHRQGKSKVRIMEVLFKANISFSVVSIWTDKSRTDERKMKGRGKSSICETCIKSTKTKIFTK